MKLNLALAAGLVAGVAALAQPQPGPALAVDLNAPGHPISPDIYGINWLFDQERDTNQTALAAELRIPVRRWGGNNTSRYNWKLDVMNIDADWFFEVLPDNNPHPELLPGGSSFNSLVEYTRVTGGKLMGAIPILGWLPSARRRMCSFSVTKYGPQKEVDPYWPDCGNGVTPDGKTNIRNDPHDANAEFDESYQRDWIKYLVSKYGRADQGGVAIWSLDNEPVWWDSTHRDIHPQAQTYDETIQAGLTYAQAIKEADPAALVAGPVSAGWESFFFSKKDMDAGWSARAPWKYWFNPIDRNAHGGAAFVPWYLQQFRSYEAQHGKRLLDYLDLHAYILPDGFAFQPAGDAATQAKRLELTRTLWDPAYMPGREDMQSMNEGTPQLVPRMRRWVAGNYPGTKTAITEYNWGALDHINGALAQADILGIFGREGLDMATLWGPPKLTGPGAFAFRIYRNYDGIGGSFGDTSVQASSADQGQLAIYAAQRSDTALTLMVINKTATDLTSELGIAGFTPAASAQVWRYSQARLDAIVREPDLPVSAAGLTAMFPAYSMTLLVVPAVFAAPKPAVQAVTNAASYGTGIAPGQMVVVWGSAMGPDAIQTLTAAQPNGVVANEMAGVRVLFDGVPAPLVYAGAKQCAAVVPYLAALKPATHVQVEYNGRRSDPLEVAIAPTGPGLFTANMRGSGQGAITNSDNRTANSPAAPAKPGDVVVLWLTGEGVTNPPGVDGRLAIEILPKPIADVSVEIGGLPAKVEYKGAAPYNMPGLMQINARIDANVQPGDAVPVKVRIGGARSQDGVTLAIK